MGKHFSKSNDIIAVDLSNEGSRIVYRFNNFTQLCNELHITRYILRRLISGDKREVVVRSPETKILYRIECENRFVAHARPDKFEFEEIDFTSVSNCIRFFGMSPNTYYRKLDEVGLNKEHPKPIKDKDGFRWYITFLIDSRHYNQSKTEQKYIPEEEW